MIYILIQSSLSGCSVEVNKLKLSSKHSVAVVAVK